MLFPLLFLSLFSTAFANNELCPQNNLEWEQFRNDRFPINITMGSGASTNNYPKYSQIKTQDIDLDEFSLSCIEAAKNNPKTDPQILKCIVRFEDRLKYLLAGAGSQNSKMALGYKITNDEYMKNNEPDIGVGAIPERIKNPDFLQNIQTRSGLESEVAKLREEQNAKPENKKWRILQFTSFDRGLGGANDEGRLLIAIPGDECDSFYQIVTPPEGVSDEVFSQTKLNQYSLVKVCHTRNGKPLAKSEVLFQDYWRVGEKNTQMSTRHAQGLTNQNCASCHTNGFLLPNVNETNKKLSETDEKEYDFLKNYTKKFRPPNFVSRDANGEFKTELKPENMGTPFGKFKSPEERTATLDECIGPQVKENKSKRNKISHFLNCTSCHDGTNRGTLQYSELGKMASPEKSLMADYLRNPRLHQSMGLNEDDRNLLVKCLEVEMADYQSAKRASIREYITQVPCDAKPEINPDANSAQCNLTDHIPEDVHALAEVSQAPIHNPDKSIQYTIKDPFNPDSPNSALIKNTDGTFSREVFTTVCHEGAGQCYPIRFNLKFDKDGNYKDMIPLPAMEGDKHTFTKLNHENFSPEDFKQLKSTIAAQLNKDRPYKTNPTGVLTDGMTGATLLNSETSYPAIPGAAYTTFKVVEYANQTKQEIKNLKSK